MNATPAPPGSARAIERVVNLPPDPAGREGRDQDDVHTYRRPDGRRFEVTYRGGVPDGPFHAFYADGSTGGEAIYLRGCVTQARGFTRKGRAFDELTAGPAASAALEADAQPSVEKPSPARRSSSRG